MKSNHIKIYSEIATILANSSTCDRAKVGAVILKNGRIVSTGYNGSLPGEPHCDNAGHLMHEGHCIRTVHAEQNAICNAAKNGITLKDCEIFVTHSPCPTCTKLIIQSGIKKVYFLTPYKFEDNPFTHIIPMVDLSAPLHKFQESLGNAAKIIAKTFFGGKMINLRKILPEVNTGYKPKRQLEKVLEEFKEVQEEIQAGNREKQLLENIDLLVASANLLYSANYTPKEIDYAIKTVTDKIYRRNKLKNPQLLGYRNVYKGGNSK